MKRTTTFILLLAILTISNVSMAQRNGQNFKMEGNDPVTISIDQTFSASAEMAPFDKDVNKDYGLCVSAQIHLYDESGIVGLILVDKNHDEFLIYESSPLKDGDLEVSVDQICEETTLLKNDVQVSTVKVEFYKLYPC